MSSPIDGVPTAQLDNGFMDHRLRGPFLSTLKKTGDFFLTSAQQLRLCSDYLSRACKSLQFGPASQQILRYSNLSTIDLCKCDIYLNLFQKLCCKSHFSIPGLTLSLAPI